MPLESAENTSGHACRNSTVADAPAGAVRTLEPRCPAFVHSALVWKRSSLNLDGTSARTAGCDSWVDGDGTQRYGPVVARGGCDIFLFKGSGFFRRTHASCVKFGGQGRDRRNVFVSGRLCRSQVYLLTIVVARRILHSSPFTLRVSSPQNCLSLTPSRVEDVVLEVH